MDCCSDYFEIIPALFKSGAYWVIAFSFSFYRGYYAFKIHNIKIKEKFNNHFKFNQFLLNSLGTLIGFVTLFYLLEAKEFSLRGLEFSPQDGVLLLVSFLGLTGYLPYFILLGKTPYNFDKSKNPQ